MTKRASPRLYVYASLVALGLIAGLATRRVDLFVYTTPFVILLLVGLALDEDPAIDVAYQRRHDASDPRATRSRSVVTLQSPRSVRRVEMAVPLPHGVRIVDGANVRAVELVAGEVRTVPVTIVADRWGSHSIGGWCYGRTTGRGLYRYERVVPAPATVRVYPHQHRIRAAAHPSRDAARRRRPGRATRRRRRHRAGRPSPVPTGRSPRDINWRASARRNELWITQRHPERSTDVVLFVDMFSEEMLLPAVRAAGALDGVLPRDARSSRTRRLRRPVAMGARRARCAPALPPARHARRRARVLQLRAEKNVSLIPPRVVARRAGDRDHATRRRTHHPRSRRPARTWFRSCGDRARAAGNAASPTPPNSTPSRGSCGSCNEPRTANDSANTGSPSPNGATATR